MKLSIRKVVIVPVVFTCLVLFMVFIYGGNELSGTYESESGSKTISFAGKTITLRYNYGAESRKGSYLISGNQIEFILNSDNGEKVKIASFSHDENRVTIDGERYTLLSEQEEREWEEVEKLRRVRTAERFKHEYEVASGESTSIQEQKQITPIEAQGQREQILAGIADEMVLVKGEAFMMGCVSENGVYCWETEEPAHQVSLSDFYIGKYEVTQAQWKAVMGIDNNLSACKGDDLPVEMVSWEDAQEFIDKLNMLTGKNYRLPTEAEWEYAARGGNKSNGYTHSGSNDLDEVAWHRGNSMGGTHSVGTKQPNELGIYDMSGNVYEWVYDRLGDYTSSTQENPQGPFTGVSRVVRGGSIIEEAMTRFLLFRRVSGLPWVQNSFSGFRLAYSTD